MSDPDRLLADLWAEDQPPARDAVFVVAVMQKAARRRLWADIAALAPFCVAAAVALWAVSPALASTMAGVIRSLPSGPGPAVLTQVVAALVTSAGIWFWVSSRAEA